MTKKEIEAARGLVSGHINWAANMGFEAPPREETEQVLAALDALCTAAEENAIMRKSGETVKVGFNGIELEFDSEEDCAMFLCKVGIYCRMKEKSDDQGSD